MCSLRKRKLQVLIQKFLKAILRNLRWKSKFKVHWTKSLSHWAVMVHTFNTST